MTTAGENNGSPTWESSYESVLRSLKNILDNRGRPFGLDDDLQRYRSSALIDNAQVLERLIDRLAVTEGRSPIAAEWWFELATNTHRLGNAAAAPDSVDFNDEDRETYSTSASVLSEAVPTLTNAIIVAESDAISERSHLSTLTDQAESLLARVQDEHDAREAEFQSSAEKLIADLAKSRDQSAEALAAQKRTVARTAFYVRSEDFAEHADNSRSSMNLWRGITVALSVCALVIALFVANQSPVEVTKSPDGTITSTPTERSPRDLVLAATTASVAVGLSVWAARQAAEAKREMSASNDISYRLNAIDAYFSDLSEEDRAQALRDLAPMLLGHPIFQHDEGSVAQHDPSLASQILKLLNERAK